MKTLLIVIDMQNDFINGALGTDEAMLIVPNVIEKIKHHEGTIIFTRDTHDESYLNGLEGKNLPVVHCVQGTYGWELEPTINKLAIEKNSLIINKPTFGSMELASTVLKLCEKGEVEEIQIVGLCTDICVIANAMALKSAVWNIPISVDSSCCAGVTIKTHQNALEAMKMCQIVIV